MLWEENQPAITWDSENILSSRWNSRKARQLLFYFLFRSTWFHSCQCSILCYIFNRSLGLDIVFWLLVLYFQGKSFVFACRHQIIVITLLEEKNSFVLKKRYFSEKYDSCFPNHCFSTFISLKNKKWKINDHFFRANCNGKFSRWLYINVVVVIIISSIIIITHVLLYH